MPEPWRTLTSIRNEVTEEWKREMYAYLRHADTPAGVPVRLAALALRFPRPAGVGTARKLFQVLHCDERFVLEGRGVNITVRFGLTVNEAAEEAAEEWRREIHDYIRQEGVPVRLTALGMRVPRPAGMNRKLRQVLAGDARFDLEGSGDDVTVRDAIARVQIAREQAAQERGGREEANMVAERSRVEVGEAQARPNPAGPPNE